MARWILGGIGLAFALIGVAWTVGTIAHLGLVG
jgi:hypothetical protein